MTKTGNLTSGSPCEYCGKPSVVIRAEVPLCETHANSMHHLEPGKADRINKVAVLLEAPTQD